MSPAAAGFVISAAAAAPPESATAAGLTRLGLVDSSTPGRRYPCHSEQRLPPVPPGHCPSARNRSLCCGPYRDRRSPPRSERSRAPAATTCSVDPNWSSHSSDFRHTTCCPCEAPLAVGLVEPDFYFPGSIFERGRRFGPKKVGDKRGRRCRASLQPRAESLNRQIYLKNMLPDAAAFRQRRSHASSSSIRQDQFACHRGAAARRPAEPCFPGSVR